MYLLFQFEIIWNYKSRYWNKSPFGGDLSFASEFSYIEIYLSKNFYRAYNQSN